MVFQRAKKILSAHLLALKKEKKQDVNQLSSQLAAAVAKLEVKANNVRVVLSRASAREEITRGDLSAVSAKIEALTAKMQQDQSDQDAADFQEYLADYQAEQLLFQTRLKEDRKHTRAIKGSYEQIVTTLRSIRDQKDLWEARFHAAQATQEAFDLAGAGNHTNGRPLMEEFADQIRDMEFQTAAIRELLPEDLKWDLEFAEQKGKG